MSLPKANAFEPPQPKKSAVSSGRRSVKDSFTDPAGPKIKATFEFDKELHQRLKIAAVNEGRTMRQIVEGLVAEYLDS